MNRISRNYELRYFSKDIKANGETDFKGETSTLTTEQRIDYLNTYARKLPRVFEDFSLDKPVVLLEEAKERLAKIKPQPAPEIRKRLPLEEWRWIGHKPDGENQSMHISGDQIEIPTQNWRSFLEWELTEKADYRNQVFAFGRAVIAGFDSQNKLYYIAKKQKVTIGEVPNVQKLKMELDFVYHKWNLYVNDRLYADFVEFSEPDVEEATFFTAPTQAGTPILKHIWGVGYYRLTENAFEPFRIETFVDEDFSEPVRIEGWNQAMYDDSGWKTGVLPIVHGGERYAGQDIYMRKTIELDRTPPYARLYIESLTPGGELYVNGRLAALIKDECCHQIDVSDYVKEGENLIAVRVYADEIKPCDKMTHTQTDVHTGWFCGRMHLDLLPEIYIEDVFSWTEMIVGGSAKQKVRVSVKAQRAMASAKAEDHEIHVCMMPWFPEEGSVCAQAEWTTGVLPNMAETSEGSLTIPSPRLWTTASPNLYKIVVELKNAAGEILDDYIITTGVRTVSQENGIFRINGRPELLRAPLLFGARPPMDKIAAWDRCPPAEYYVQEMLMVRRMNGNGIRMSVHDKRIGGTNDPRICELADQMGIMLIWQTTTWLRITSATNLNFNELAACIKQVRNHCSIVIWQPANHPSWKDWDTIMRIYRMITDTIRPLDNSRLISPSADSRRMRPRWDDGFTDFNGNSCDSCDPAWTAEGICRGNMDYILGYGNEWSALRQWPEVEEKNLPDYMESTAYIPSYLNSKERAYFNFEHDEIIGQPNWDIHKGKPTYHVKSYEYYYDEGSIGRELSFDEWQTSQAWQALGAYEVICKSRWLDYDGLCWCNLRGGLNTGTYQKSLVDYYGQPKLAYYAHQMAFQDVIACSGNVDMVYGPDDTLPVVVLHIGAEKKVDVCLEIISEDETVICERKFENIILPEGRGAVKVQDLKLSGIPEGLYSILYSVYTA